MTDVTAKNINLLGIRAHAYHARARKHTLTSKHPSNCWTQRASHRNHPISASTHCISIDFSKKVQFLVLFYLFGAISLYILVEGVPPRPTLTVLLCTPPQSPCLAFYAFTRNATEMPQNKFCNTSASIPVYRSNCRLTLYDSTTASCFYNLL